MTSPPTDDTAPIADAARDGKTTRGVVLAAALEIIDRDGAGGPSMRRLACAVNRDPMVLYRHAPNKAALLDGVAEIVLAQLKVDPADPTGPRSCAPSPGTTAGWRWPTRTWCRCWSPVRWPPRWDFARRAPCARSKTSSHCSPGPGSAGLTPCTSTVPCSGSCTATSSTSCRNSSRIRTRRTTCCGWPAPAADRRIPATAQPRLRPGLLRRRRRTRARPRHPPGGPDHHTDSQEK